MRGARRGLAVLLAGVALASAPAGVGADPLATALGQMAARIERLSDLRGKKLGVGDFPMAGGRLSELGSYFADQLDVALTGRAAAAGFEVVTRSQLCQIIRENKLWVDDRFDPSLHKKLGRLGQADLMVTGQLTALSRQVSMSVRILDSETGRALWAETLQLPLDEALRGLVARPIVGDGCGQPASVAAPPPSPADADRLQVKVWTDRPSYRIGETLNVGLRVNRDAYVTLVDIGTSGDVTVIFPNRFHPSHFVRGGQDVVVPPPGSGFSLVVQGPVGFDQIRAIATEEPVKLLASDFTGQTATFRSLDRVQTRNLSVVIGSERDKAVAGKWAEQVIAVEIGR